MDKHTTDELGLAWIVHGPGRIVANTMLAPETCTTLGGVSEKEHWPVPSSPDGAACATPPGPTPMRPITAAAESATDNRGIIPGSYRATAVSGSGWRRGCAPLSP